MTNNDQSPRAGDGNLPKPCLVAGDCKHGAWCSDVYCQEHCQFVKSTDALDALAKLCDMATGGWDLPPSAVYRIGELARKARAAMLAAAPALSAPAWQPIETAPKDGSLFLCWVLAVRYGETDEGQQYQEDVSQADFCHWQSHDDAPDGGWFEPCCGQIGDGQDVTHWMPLPAAPGFQAPATADGSKA